MNKIELINFLKDNVNGKGYFDRDVEIVTGKKQAYKVFNLISYGKSKTKIGYYDDGFKIFSSLQEIDDLDEFIDTLDTVMKVEVLPYHTLGEYKWKELGIPYKLEGVDPPTDDRVQNAKKILEFSKY